MNRISIKGVAIGNLVDIASSYLAVVPIGIFMLMRGYPIDPTALTENGTFILAASVSAGLCSILGGYIAARIAKHDEVLNGALSSILGVGIGVYTIISGGAADQLGLNLALLPVGPLLGALGGYLRFRRASVSDCSGKKMSRISIKGVAIGNLVDMASFYLVSFPIVVFMVMREYPLDQPLESGTFFVLGGMCSVLGGFVAARIAGHDEILNGALSSIVWVGIHLYPILSGSVTGHYLIQGLIELPLGPVLAAIGGSFCLRTRAQQP